MAEQRNEKSVFLAAVEIDSDRERAAYVEQACAGNPQLRAEVDALLRAHAKPQPLLDARPTPGPTIGERGTEDPGTVIGPYKLLEQIGEGGMGTVWMAEQTEPLQRRVAVKVIKAGMDSKQVLARFEAERHALALMDHPNIARVLDAGTTATGRPYFVMELVKGTPVTNYCDDKHVSVRERLELFGDVCRAVQHAHQKGIVHRDLKPSNILIALFDGKPVVKVIDFGVAKATGQRLTDATLFTGFGAVVGTPEYMSPEQAEANNQDIDTRSDIYSLGVLLYELLTGSTPLTKKRVKEAALLEVLRVIREEEPPKPSTRLSSTEELPSISAQRHTEPAKLTKLVRGELDWIVMKALEKDRSRRYETANGFAMDVQRYLADEAVLACPPSAGYRFRKFARRNRAALATAGLVLFFILLLGGGVGWALYDQAVRQGETDRAVTAALAQAETLLAEGDKQTDHPERWQATARLALAALEKAEDLLATGPASEELFGRVRQVRAAVDAAANESCLLVELDRIRLEQAAVKEERFDRARAVPLYAKAFGDHGIDLAAPEEAAARVRASRLREALLAALEEWSRVTEDKEERQRLERVLQAAEPEPTAFRARWRAAVRQRDGAALVRLPDEPEVRGLPAADIVQLARDLERVNELAAERLLRAGQERYPSDFWLNHDLGRLLYRQNPPRAEEGVRYLTAALALRSDSPGVHLNLGVALVKKGDLDGAIRRFQVAVRIDPKYAVAHENLGRALFDKGQLDEAITKFQEAIRLKKDLSTAHYFLGDCWRAKGRLNDAITEYRKAIHFKPNFAEAHSSLSAGLVRKGRLDEAIAVCNEAIALKLDCAEVHNNLGLALVAKGQLDQAIAEHRKAIHFKKDLPEAHFNLGNALGQKGRLDEAIAAYRQAIALKPDYAEAHCNLGNPLMAKGRLDEAIAEFQEAIRLNKDDPIAHYGRGNTLYLKGQLEQAITEFQEAIRLQKDYPLAHYGLGNALRQKGRLDEALAAFRRAIALKPDFVEAHYNLGHALRIQGRFAESLQAIKAAHELCSRSNGRHSASAAWVRQAERLVELDAKLPKVLNGESQPADVAERLQLAWLCQQPHKELYAASARLFSAAFADDPKLGKANRYNAACAAALAGCGQGKDAGKLAESERARLRRQALDWLKADLAAWRQQLEKDPTKARITVPKQMEHWQRDADFAHVRGPEALARLPEAERSEWQKLWEEVAAIQKRAVGMK